MGYRGEVARRRKPSRRPGLQRLVQADAAVRIRVQLVRGINKLDFGFVAPVMILDRDTELRAHRWKGAREEIPPPKASTP